MQDAGQVLYSKVILMVLSEVDVYGPRPFATPYLELDRFHGC